MMAGENCVGQVIEARLTDRAAVTLALWLPVVMTMPGHLVTLAYWATHALGPPQTPDHVEALGLIDQGLKVDQAVHRPASSCWWRTRPRWIKPFLGPHPSPQQVAITIGSSARSPPPRNPNRAFFESHAARHEDQISRAHPDRSGGDRRDAQFGAAGEHLGAHVQHEEVEPVDEQIDAVQEIVDVVIVDAIGETPDFSGRVDIPDHAGHHIDLGLAERTDGSADLTVEVDRLEDIHIRDMERPDAKTGQRQQMQPADTAHTGDGHPFDAQYLLLPLGDPSNVATERLVIIEVEAARGHRQDVHGRQVPLSLWVFGSISPSDCGGAAFRQHRCGNLMRFEPGGFTGGSVIIGIVQRPQAANGGGSQSRRRVLYRGVVSMGSHSIIEVLLLRTGSAFLPTPGPEPGQAG